MDTDTDTALRAIADLPIAAHLGDTKAMIERIVAPGGMVWGSRGAAAIGTARAINVLVAERLRQVRRGYDIPHDDRHDEVFWARLVGEMADKLKAVVAQGDDSSGIMHELVQIGAVCLAAVEDNIRWNWPDLTPLEGD